MSGVPDAAVNTNIFVSFINNYAYLSFIRSLFNIILYFKKYYEILNPPGERFILSLTDK